MKIDGYKLSMAHLILTGLWLIIRAHYKLDGIWRGHYATTWRAQALEFMDEIGVEGEEAKKYRRENAFPE